MQCKPTDFLTAKEIEDLRKDIFRRLLLKRLSLMKQKSLKWCFKSFFKEDLNMSMSKEEAIRLTNILHRTKKMRVKLKLSKRISEGTFWLFSWMVEKWYGARQSTTWNSDAKYFRIN